MYRITTEISSDLNCDLKTYSYEIMDTSVAYLLGDTVIGDWLKKKRKRMYFACPSFPIHLTNFIKLMFY